MDTVHQFFRCEDGQDLVEYTLLLALISMAAFLILQQTGASTRPIWAAGSTELQDAAVSVSGEH
jgi:Flp pilus assembly pilin Flp